MRNKIYTLGLLSVITVSSWAQPDRWQQRVKYTMDIAMNVTTNRFTGKAMLYYNAELRVKLFDFASYFLPGLVGLVGFNDVGRIWVPEETSSNWHFGYGGGIYIIPADLVLIQAVLGFSRERVQPYISLGFMF